MAADSSDQPFFGLLRFGQADHSSGSDGPLEMGAADLFIGPSGALAVGLLFGSDQPGIGAKALHRAKALDVVHFVQNCQRIWPTPGIVLSR
jgi:hypothetical protein